MASKSGVNITNVPKADIAARSEATATGQSGSTTSTDTGDAAADEAFKTQRSTKRRDTPWGCSCYGPMGTTGPPRRLRAVSGVILGSPPGRHGNVSRCLGNRRSAGQFTEGIAQALSGGSGFILCELITARTSASGFPETAREFSESRPVFPSTNNLESFHYLIYTHDTQALALGR
jgi:hypothetical protein